MYGYVYKTTNKITKEMYIGQKKSPYFVDDYYGSGRNIKDQLLDYGKCSFKVKMLKAVESQEELDFYEKFYIKKYKDRYKDKCLNIASGGYYGANMMMYASDEKKAQFLEKMKETHSTPEFIAKMTEINRARCQSDEFRQACSERTKIRYSDPEERRKHSEIVKKAWSNPELIEAQRQRSLAYFAEHPMDFSHLHKPCAFRLGDIYHEFESVNDLRDFLLKEYQYNPDRRTFKRLMEQGAKGIPYEPFHKARMGRISGMMVYYLN